MFVLSVVSKSHTKKDASSVCLVVGRNVHKEGVTESRIDAWKDIAGYAILALMLDDDSSNLELRENKKNPVGHVEDF